MRPSLAQGYVQTMLRFLPLLQKAMRTDPLEEWLGGQSAEAMKIATGQGAGTGMEALNPFGQALFEKISGLKNIDWSGYEQPKEKAPTAKEKVLRTLNELTQTDPAELQGLLTEKKLSPGALDVLTTKKYEKLFPFLGSEKKEKQTTEERKYGEYLEFVELQNLPSRTPQQENRYKYLMGLPNVKGALPVTSKIKQPTKQALIREEERLNEKVAVETDPLKKIELQGKLDVIEEQIERSDQDLIRELLPGFTTGRAFTPSGGILETPKGVVGGGIETPTVTAPGLEDKTGKVAGNLQTMIEAGQKTTEEVSIYIDQNADQYRASGIDPEELKRLLGIM